MSEYSGTMKKAFIVVICLLMSLFCMEGTGSSNSGNFGRQVPAELSMLSGKELHVRYLVYLPQDYPAQKEWPLVVFLHGAGERGNDLALVKKHGPPKLIEEGKQFPFILVSPQCPEGAVWDAKAVIRLIDYIEKHYNVDDNRVYVTGLSMGAFATWEVATMIPHRLAAIVPICGGCHENRISNLGDLPVWAFHGLKDDIVPVGSSRSVVDALKQCGGNVKFTIYPEAGHDSWTATYDNPEVFKWMLQQNLSRRHG